MNETCIKHALNMPDIDGCPYCKIQQLTEALRDIFNIREDNHPDDELLTDCVRIAEAALEI